MEGLILSILLAVTPVAAEETMPRLEHSAIVRPMPGIQVEQTEDGASVVTSRKGIAGRQDVVGTIRTIPRVPVILVNFSNWSMRTPRAYVDSMFNGVKWRTELSGFSVRRYFSDASAGAYVPQFDIYGPVTISGAYTDYYQINSSTGATTLNKAKDVVRLACDAVNDSVDFSLYDSDSDGKIDLVYILYAGYGSNDYQYIPADSVPGANKYKLIWPHYNGTVTQGTYDGVTLRDYECSNELDGLNALYHLTPNIAAGIGTVVHEFCHALGLADLYRTSGYDNFKRMGQWDVMDQGCYNQLAHLPATLSAWQRWCMGWIQPEMLDAVSTDTLPSLLSSNKAYYIPSDGQPVQNPMRNAAPFFMLENRQNGTWDWMVPGHGMLITKITYKSSIPTWQGCNNAQPFGVDIQEADGLAPSAPDPDYQGKPGDAFPTGATEAEPVAGCPITNIEERGGVITFNYKGNPTAVPTTVERRATKSLRNGRIEIERDGRVYDLDGHLLDGSHIAPRRGIPAYPGKIKRIQENGDTLTIYMRGDERGHFAITEDGFRIVQWGNSYYYAQRRRGEIVRSDRLAQDPDRRNRKSRCWLRRRGIRELQNEN